MFALLTRYANQSDNHEDNSKRAEVLGFGGRDVKIAPGAIVRVNPDRIGSNIFIGLYCYLNGPVTIGNNVLIGPHCSITAGHHKFDPATGWFSARTGSESDDSIVIGEGSWLASGVTVTAGVKIGKANLICAHAVVTKSTPDYAIMAGVPAVMAGRIDPETGVYHWLHRVSKDEKPAGEMVHGTADDDFSREVVTREMVHGMADDSKGAKNGSSMPVKSSSEPEAAT
jgi:acetyltransferase-like isoleucine patch superfamily enzyme